MTHGALLARDLGGLVPSAAVSSLLLIRHGQASFGAEDYDVLSPTGIRQAQCLGEHLATFDPMPDAIYCGPKKRHLGTARHMIDAARGRDKAFPEPTIVNELDEYPAFELLRHWQEQHQLAQRDARRQPDRDEKGRGPTGVAPDSVVQVHAPNVRGGEGPPTEDLAAIVDASAHPATTQRAFERVIAKWVSGELSTGELESFADFCARVERGLDQIMAAEGRGRRILVVTSGGPIAVSVRRSLGLTGEMMMKVSWVVANGSVTELRYRESELSLFGFNVFAHLSAQDLVTYR